jgi:hypothetical protein
MDLYSRQIWTVGPSHPILEELLVIGPYPSPEFFGKILHEFEPRNLTLVIDGACEDAVLRAIGKLFPANKQPQVRFAWCGGGIVHAKLYYLRWKHAATTNFVCKLIWGSLNASQNGFERNAETLSHASLPFQRGHPFFDYFERFRAQTGNVEQVSVPLGKAGLVTLVLPAFDFTSDRIPPPQASFESWVQSGILCHKYERDSSFLRFRVRLKKPLPADFVKAQLVDVGIVREKERSESFLYKYIPRPDVKESAAKWRWKYFLDTRLGFWTSRECYESKRALFKAQGADERAKDVADLRNPDIRKWYSEIAQKLHTVQRRLQDAHRDPSEYFWLGPNRGTDASPRRYIDGNKYKPDLERQAKKDNQRLTNKAFLDRFITGYELFPVPDLRSSEAEFEKFLVSLCQSVLDALHAGKRATNLLVETLAKSLRELGHDLEKMDAPRLLRAISHHWKTIGVAVRAFHQAPG